MRLFLKLKYFFISASLFDSNAFSVFERQRTYNRKLQEKGPSHLMSRNIGNTLLDTLDKSLDYQGRMFSENSDFRCGFVCILGQPNMGKSTLLNALLAEKLCISSPRPQTTRHAILGLLTTNSSQICLFDTPGVIESPAYKLQDVMMEAVRSALNDADVLLLVTDLVSVPSESDIIFQKVQRSSKPTIVCINKIDMVDRINSKNKMESLRLENDEAMTTNKTVERISVESVIARWRKLLPNAIAILPITASEGPNNCGVVALRRLLTCGPELPEAWRGLGRPLPGILPSKVGKFLYYTDQQAVDLLNFTKSPPLYDPEILTDRTERFIASELIRASSFETLQKELPYCCQVQVNAFKEAFNILRMSATISVERDSQKIIVIGKGGKKIKEVGINARKKLQDFFQTKVHLDLKVKVDKDWRKSEKQLKAFGYIKS